MVDETLKPGGTVLVTGASGFVGRAVCAALAQAGYKPRPVGRHDVGEIHRGTDWGQALQDCQAVVHLAARVHIMGPDSAKGEDAFREVNLHGTANLVRQAADRGIGRFVFMSTIKVLGENGVEVTPDDPPAPFDAYAVSKTEAEAAVRELSGDPAPLFQLRAEICAQGVKACGEDQGRATGDQLYEGRDIEDGQPVVEHGQEDPGGEDAKDASAPPSKCNAAEQDDGQGLKFHLQTQRAGRGPIEAGDQKHAG